MFKECYNLFKIYLKQYGIINFSILFLPILNYFSSLFILRKKIILNDYEGRKKIIILKLDNTTKHFRSILFLKKEKEVRFFIDKYLDNNSTFIDIGANIGTFSLYAAVKKNALVHAFEPEYSNLSILKETIINSNLNKNIKPYSIAIGDKDRLTNLHITNLMPGSAMNMISDSNIEKVENKLKVIWKEGVMELTLDKVCNDLNLSPSMIKIDTDGNEPKVLIGGNQVLKSDKLKYIILEKPLDSSKKEYCFDYLKNLNFVQEGSFPTNSFWIKKK